MAQCKRMQPTRLLPPHIRQARATMPETRMIFEHARVAATFVRDQFPYSQDSIAGEKPGDNWWSPTSDTGDHVGGDMLGAEEGAGGWLVGTLFPGAEPGPPGSRMLLSACFLMYLKTTGEMLSHNLRKVSFKAFGSKNRSTLLS